MFLFPLLLSGALVSGAGAAEAKAESSCNRRECIEGKQGSLQEQFAQSNKVAKGNAAVVPEAEIEEARAISNDIYEEAIARVKAESKDILARYHAKFEEAIARSNAIYEEAIARRYAEFEEARAEIEELRARTNAKVEEIIDRARKIHR